MVRSRWISLLASPAVFAMMLVVSATAMAAAALATEVAQPQAGKTQILKVKPVVMTKQLNGVKDENPTPVAVTPKLQLVADQPVTSTTTPVPESPNVIDQVVRESKEDTSSQDDLMAQVTSVSQLRDVQPTDWAFQALQSLVERYGCIAGYPDGTYRGNRALTRYEFAAGVKSCLDRVNELIASGTSDLVRKEDIATLQRLQQEFATELTALHGRVDNLEAQTAQLEANQFSTTTKLVGEAVFGLFDNFGKGYNERTVFEDRVRLDFQTSFFGQDTLHTRLVAGNAQQLNYQRQVAPGGFSTYEGEGSSTLTEEPFSTNAVAVDWLSYYVPLTSNSQVYLVATGGLTNDIAPSGQPYFNDGDGGTGALSLFAQENPIYRIGGGSGAGVNFALSKAGSLFGQTSVTAVYLADNAAFPGNGGSLFNGDYVALGQINYNLNDRFAVTAIYSHAYHSTGTGIFNNAAPGSRTSPFLSAVGTAEANDPSILLPGGQRPTVTNSYGVNLAFRVSKKIVLTGYVDETNARILGRGDANIWTYAAGVAFPDLGKEGNVLGLLVGVEPTLKGLRAVGVPRNFGRRDEAYHFEGFYKYQLTDNISITPGLIVLTAPGQNIRNNDVFIGTFRTTFTF